MTAPKLFISYSWSNPEHEQWVVDLATELRESGVDVILDKWDLKEGNDAVAFMEQMVTNPEIKKVVIVSDEIYAAKADGRSGGVGTETQIISKEVYDNQAQDKFVAVISEKDNDDKPFLPTYYKSRIYIDLSEADKYSENFERLLRWIFDKPLYVKPNIGSIPSFLADGGHISLGTTATFKRCVEALRNGRSYSAGTFDEYCNVFASNFEQFRISKYDGEFDDAVVKSIEEFLPFRNEAIQLFTTVAQYSPTPEVVQRTHRFFESLIPYMQKPEDVTSWTEWEFDNFKFLIHELFLYVVTIFIKHERFQQANNLLSQQYYLPGNSDYGRNVMVSFTVFSESMRSLVHRNQRLKLNRVSVMADILEQRSKGSGVAFRDLMQTDFVLFLRAERDSENFSSWWPDTLVYIYGYHSAFEIFARSVSRSYFDKVKCLLAIDKVSDLSEQLEGYKADPRRLPKLGIRSFSPSTLLGFEQLCKKA
ncbi:MAG: TIR domain-containing protein [Deltaproteobacteria bacterium]|nr:TIR domain-containing protein [Deltaproteobacteria bacterium]